MKIIHTSDWHLGHRLYNYDRSDEEDHFFLQLSDLVCSEQPDALVVCGDVFHTGAPGNDVAKVFTDRLLEVAARCPDMVTAVIAGNHDSYSRLIVDKTLWERCHVHVFGLPAEDNEGKAVFAENVVVLSGKGVVAAVPFCHDRNFPAAEGVAEGDRMKAYFAGLRKFIDEKNAANLPTVLMAHLAVGKETDFTGQERGGVIGGEECVELETLGGGYDYVALGHVHCPQWIGGENRIARYCGTPRAIHFDETYAHGADVVTVEAGRKPVVRTVAFEPLRRLETVGGKDGLPFEEALKALSEAETLPRETYVRLNVALQDGMRLGPDWSERARQVSAAHGWRFCLVNPIRHEAKKDEAATRPVLTTEELKTLSDEKVIEVLSARHPLTDRQRALIKGLMEESK